MERSTASTTVYKPLSDKENELFNTVTRASWHIRPETKKEKIKSVLGKGARFDAQDKYGQTLLHVAIPENKDPFDKSQLEVFELLVQRICQQPDDELKKRLFNQLKPAQTENSLWFEASQRAEIINVLFKHNAPLPEDPRELTSLLYALFRIKFKNFSAIEKIITQLGLTFNGEITLKWKIVNDEELNDVKTSFLHLSLEMHPDVFPLLMKFEQFNIQVIDFEGCSLLHSAVRYRCESALPLLFARKIELETVNSNGRTALQLACGYRSSYPRQPKMVAALCQEGARIDLADDPRFPSLLHYALGNDLPDLATEIMCHNPVDTLNLAFSIPEKQNTIFPLHNLMGMKFHSEKQAKESSPRILARLNSLDIDYHVRDPQNVLAHVYAIQARNILGLKHLLAKTDFSRMPSSDFMNFFDATLVPDSENLTQMARHAYEMLSDLLAVPQIAASVNQPNAESWTPLHRAVIADDDRMVALLLKHGAKLDISDPELKTQSVIEFSLRKGKYKSALALLNAETFPIRTTTENPNEHIFHWRGQDGKSAFDLAKENPEAQVVYLRITSLLSQPLFQVLAAPSTSQEEKQKSIEALLPTIAIDSQNSAGQTVLHWLTEHKQVDLFLWLVERLAKDLTMAVHVINELKDNQGKTVWDVTSAKPAFIKILRDNGIPLPSSCSEHTLFNLLFVTIRNQPIDYGLVEELLKRGAGRRGFIMSKQYTTWLIEVIKKKDEKLFGLFLEVADEAALQEEDERRYAPVHWVVLSGNAIALKALLVKGAPVNGSRDANVTPLKLACGFGFSEANPRPEYLPDVKMIKTLCGQGASLQGGYLQHATLLHEALREGEDCKEVVLALIESASEVQLREAMSKKYYIGPFQYPLHELMQFNFTEDEWQRIFTRLSSVTIDFNPIEDEFKSTPLHYAAVYQNVGAFRGLLGIPAVNRNAVNSSSFTVLHHIIPDEDNTSFSEENVLSLLNLFLQQPKGRDQLNKRADNGLTPLHSAVLLDSEKIVACLVDHEADVTLAETDLPSQSVIEYALRQRKFKASAALLQSAMVQNWKKEKGEELHILNWRIINGKSPLELVKDDPEAKPLYLTMCKILGSPAPIEEKSKTEIVEPAPTIISSEEKEQKEIKNVFKAEASLEQKEEANDKDKVKSNKSRSEFVPVGSTVPFVAPSTTSFTNDQPPTSGFSQLVPPSKPDLNHKAKLSPSRPALIGWISFFACLTVASLLIMGIGISLLAQTWPLVMISFIPQFTAAVELAIGIGTVVFGGLLGVGSTYGLAKNSMALHEMSQVETIEPRQDIVTLSP